MGGDNIVLCRVTVSLPEAPLGSTILVDVAADWVGPFLERGILVPLQPLTPQEAAGSDAGATEDSTSEAAQEAATDAPDALEASEPAELSA